MSKQIWHVELGRRAYCASKINCTEEQAIHISAKNILYSASELAASVAAISMPFLYIDTCPTSLPLYKATVHFLIEGQENQTLLQVAESYFPGWIATGGSAYITNITATISRDIWMKGRPEHHMQALKWIRGGKLPTEKVLISPHDYQYKVDGDFGVSSIILDKWYEDNKWYKDMV